MVKIQNTKLKKRQESELEKMMNSSSQTLKPVRFHIVTTKEADESHSVFTQLVDLYIVTFADAPYYEAWIADDVEKEFRHYIKNGVLFCALINDRVVGFLCVTYGMEHCNEDIKKELESVGILTGSDLYIADLAVSKVFRRQKIGSSLMDEMLSQHSNENVYLRTSAANDNEKVIAFYEKFRFATMKKREQVKNTRTDGSVDYDERLYMYKIQTFHDSDRYEGDGYKSGAEYLY